MTRRHLVAAACALLLLAPTAAAAPPAGGKLGEHVDQELRDEATAAGIRLAYLHVDAIARRGNQATAYITIRYPGHRAFQLTLPLAYGWYRAGPPHIYNASR